jgi:hypothetical protein
MLRSRRPTVTALLALAFAGVIGPGGAGAARASSALRLEAPRSFGEIPAATYDAERAQVGDAGISIEKGEDGRVVMSLDEGFTGGARTRVRAILEPVGDGWLAPVLQESRSFDAEGRPLGVLTVDHKAAVATCATPEGKVVEVPLPEEDRVANTTLSLLLLPLVRGETEQMDFQLFLCGGGPKVMDFVANRAPDDDGVPADKVVEVRYGPDFGFASLVAKSFVPKLSVWFDTRAPYRWLAHRLPLYGGGPEVFVVRSGIPLRWLGND